MREFFIIIIFGLICSHLPAQQLTNGSNGALASGNSSSLSAIENAAEALQIRVYPNPVSDLIHVTVTDKVIGSTVKIHSLLGTEVISKNVTEGQEAIDVSSLQQGLYLYNILDKNNKVILSGKFNKL